MDNYTLDVREVNLLRLYLQEQKSIYFISRKFTKPTLTKMLICLWLPTGGSKKEIIVKLQNWDATHRFAGLIKEANDRIHHTAEVAKTRAVQLWHEQQPIYYITKNHCALCLKLNCVCS